MTNKQDQTTISNSVNSVVYKEQELAQMIELVKSGIWRDVNISRVLNVDQDTVAKWKKRPEVQEAYRQTVMRVAKKRTDAELILKELKIEVDNQQTDHNVYVIPIYGGKSVPQLKDFNEDNKTE